MKYLFLIAGFLSSGALATASVHGAGATWKVESEKTVYYVMQPRLEVQVTNLEVDEQIWGRVYLSASYTSEAANAQLDELRKEFPGYELKRALSSPTGTYTLEIPSLDVKTPVNIMNSPEGPHLHWEAYVSKKDMARVRKALENPSAFLSLNGNVRARVVEEQVADSARLPADTCKEFFRSGTDLYAAMRGFAAVEEKILAVTPNADLQEGMRKLVLSSCVKLSVPAALVKSFKDLLDLKLKREGGKEDFYLEVRKKIWTEKNAPFSYRFEIGSGD
jgi:hypothetical protein